MQNSEAVLWSGRGNDADQVTLLIALLRAPVFQPDTSCQDQHCYADAINWVGAKDKSRSPPTQAVYIGRPPSSPPIWVPSSRSCTPGWKPGWITARRGPAWIAMSPGLKKQTFQPGLEIPIPVFDRAQFLSAPTTRLASDVYADQIHAALAQSFPGHDLSELGYTGTIVPARRRAATVPLHARHGLHPRRGATADRGMERRHSHSSIRHQKVYLAGSFFLPEISLQSRHHFLHSRHPCRPEHHQQFRRHRQCAGRNGESSGAIQAGRRGCRDVYSFHCRRCGISLIASGHRGQRHRRPVLHGRLQHDRGAPDAVVMVGPQISNAWIGSRIDGLLAGLPTASLDTTLRETLFLAGILHNQDIQEAWSGILLPLQYTSDYALHTPFAAFLMASAIITPLFDRPFLAAARYFSLDDGFDPPRPFNLNAPAGNATDVNLYQVIDVTRSQSECRTFERVALEGSACTVNVLQAASQHKFPILVLDRPTSRPCCRPSGVCRQAGKLLPGNRPLRDNHHPESAGHGRELDRFPLDPRLGLISTPSFFGLDYANGGYTIDDGTATPVATCDGVTGDPTPVNGTTLFRSGDRQQRQHVPAADRSGISSRGPGFVLTRTYNSFTPPTTARSATDGPTATPRISKDNGSSVTLVNGSGGVYNFGVPRQRLRGARRST